MNHAFSANVLSSWSRQQKLAMIAGFAILGLLLALSACSKGSAKPALGSSSSAPGASAQPQPGTQQTTPPGAYPPGAQGPAIQVATPKAGTKKAAKQRPANVTFSDPNSGVSFIYPRKFSLASSDRAAHLAADEVPMNFVQAGGIAIATVALPSDSYRGTDFASAFFSVNMSRSLSEQECSHFAFVDTSDADGEPIDAEKVRVESISGSEEDGPAEKEMEMTSEFTGSATRQVETQYYHSYENGACYEYVLGLGTAGYGAGEASKEEEHKEEGLKPVDREGVFARLEKILTTVKTRPAAPAAAAEQTVAAASATK